MDKQNQIDEMAIMISGSTEMDTMGYYRSVEKAKNIYNAGYRKIPENALVLEQDDYDNLVNRAEYAERELALHYKTNGEVRKETAEKFASKLADYFVEHCAGRLNISLTLKEWYEMIDEICKDLLE